MTTKPYRIALSFDEATQVYRALVNASQVEGDKWNRERLMTLADRVRATYEPRLIEDHRQEPKSCLRG